MILKTRTGTMDALRDLAAVGRALGDPTRLRILDLLIRQGETCVCELMETLDMMQSRVSFHLMVLKHAGLIRDKKMGKWTFYNVNLKAVERHVANLKEMFEEKRLGATRAATSIFALCSRGDAVPLSRKQARQKVVELRTRDKTSAHSGKRDSRKKVES